jgi:hypothetical protein
MNRFIRNAVYAGILIAGFVGGFIGRGIYDRSNSDIYFNDPNLRFELTIKPDCPGYSQTKKNLRTYDQTYLRRMLAARVCYFLSDAARGPKLFDKANDLEGILQIKKQIALRIWEMPAIPSPPSPKDTLEENILPIM